MKVLAATPPHQELLCRLQALLTLNPDIVECSRCELLRLAEQSDPGSFTELAEFAEGLVRIHAESPWKRGQKNVLKEYLGYLERASRKLVEKGDLSTDLSTSPGAGGSVALVPGQFYSSMDWCKVLWAAQVPKGVVMAVDAARRRNQVLGSVLESLFLVLQRVDLRQGLEWELGLIERRRGELDADLVRDLLRAWRAEAELPSEVLGWALIWSADENLERQWPTVVREADLLLRRYALRGWRNTVTARERNLAHLHMMLTEELDDEGRLLRWLENSVAEIGMRVRSFVSISLDTVRAGGGEPAAWRQAVLVRELQAIEGLFPPVLILADLILAAPEGPWRFALAFFGMGPRARQAWSERLRKQCEVTVRRAFLDGLRHGHPALETVRRFCLSDPDTLARMARHLDSVTKEFDSMAERDKVVNTLAAYYASYVEGDLLAREIADRYRSLMRVLHEDNLRRLLTPEQFAEISQLAVLPELATMASEARRYLARRRTLRSELENMVAAELDFARSVRQRRLRFVRRMVRYSSPSSRKLR